MKLDLLGLDHVVLRCQDLKKMAAFYCDVLGCTMDRWRDELGLVHLRAGNTFIDLADAAKARARRGGDEPVDIAAPNMDHLCLNVANLDAAAIVAHLSAHGVKPGDPVMRYGATGDKLSVYLTDPEGNAVELRAA
jgi:glyoxylase I family protein